MRRIKRDTYTIVLLLIVVAFFLPSCNNEPQVRKLDETHSKAKPKANQTAVPDTPDLAFQWQKPNHWKSLTSRGLRLATFQVNNKVLCTIIPLSRDGGGLEANIIRWSAQLGLQLTPEEGKAFMKKKSVFKTKTGLSATLLDFDPLITEENAPSMKVTLIPVPGATLFIKMTGPKKLLEIESEAFIRFCQSISHIHQ